MGHLAPSTRPASSILLEVCVESVEDALTADAGGADRLELNSALSLGGLTPSPGTFLETRRQTQLPLLVMIRPRRSGFCYSDREFRTMLRDAEWFLEQGADGLVSGFLNQNGEIDQARSLELRKLCVAQEAVFHRAFDLTADPFASLEKLIDLGIHRILTSGQAASALEGSDLLNRLVTTARGRIEILPAGGIKAATIAELLQRVDCNQVHGSLRKEYVDSFLQRHSQVSFGSLTRTCEAHYDNTHLEAVRELRAALDRMQKT